MYGCASSSELTFEKGVEKIEEIDKKYNTTIKSPPDSIPEIQSLIAQLVGFEAVNDIPESLSYLLDFRIKFLEAEMLNAQGWQWGRGSTTEWGFGCKKGYERITNSSKLRNASSLKGYEAIDVLKEFIDKFPDEAKSLNLGQKDVLVLNAEYFQIEEKAVKDARVVWKMCIANKEDKKEE